jgi:hypothetical protein
VVKVYQIGGKKSKLKVHFHLFFECFFRVQNFRAYRVGDNAVAAGDLNIYHKTNASPIYSQIAQGFTRARNITWTVPAGKALYITHVILSCAGIDKANTATAIMTTMATYDNATGRAIDFFMPYTEIILEDNHADINLDVPTKLVAGTRLKVQARALTNNCYVTARLNGWIETL